MLHDVGKIAIPKEILQQARRAHRRRVRGHEDPHDRGPVHARPRRRPARPRRRDRALVPRALGRPGLPRRPRRASEIPLAARIVFVCDAYNAMTTDRPYRAAMPPEAALKELVDNAGTQFDPRVVAGASASGRAGRPASSPPPTTSAPCSPTAPPRRKVAAARYRLSRRRGRARLEPAVGRSTRRAARSARRSQTTRPPHPGDDDQRAGADSSTSAAGAQERRARTPRVSASLTPKTRPSGGRAPLLDQQPLVDEHQPLPKPASANASSGDQQRRAPAPQATKPTLTNARPDQLAPLQLGRRRRPCAPDSDPPTKPRP